MAKKKAAAAEPEDPRLGLLRKEQFERVQQGIIAQEQEKNKQRDIIRQETGNGDSGNRAAMRDSARAILRRPVTVTYNLYNPGRVEDPVKPPYKGEPDVRIKRVDETPPARDVRIKEPITENIGPTSEKKEEPKTKRKQSWKNKTDAKFAPGDARNHERPTVFDADERWGD
jgi:hypothetical protein